MLMLMVIISVGYEILTAVVMNVAMSFEIALCRPYVSRRFGGAHQLHFQGLQTTRTTSQKIATFVIISSLIIVVWHERTMQHSASRTLYSVILFIDIYYGSLHSRSARHKASIYTENKSHTRDAGV
jgi:hypothetical protein